MAIKRDAALVRHYARQLGLEVVAQTQDRTEYFVFMRPTERGDMEPASDNLPDCGVTGAAAALAWLAGYAAAIRALEHSWPPPRRPKGKERHAASGVS